MFKAVKDFKRRSIQTVVKTSGLKTEEIIDEDYEESVKKFRVMVNEMQTTSDTLHRFLTSQKTCYAEGKELSSSLSTVYEINGSDEWPGVISDLQFEAQSASMKEKWTEIHDIFRSSSAAVCMEYALEPIRAAVTRMAPEIESACKIRNAHHVDLESYSRRIKALSVKEEALVESGKSEKDGEKSAAAIKLEEDKGKIQIKLNTTKEHYEHHNTKSKADIVDARKVHDDLVDSLFVTTIVCQAELFAQAAAKLQEIVDALPEERVQEVRQRIQSLVQQGGVKTEPKKASTFFTRTPVPVPTPVPASITALPANEAAQGNQWDEAHMASASSEASPGVSSVAASSSSSSSNSNSSSSSSSYSSAVPDDPSSSLEKLKDSSESWEEGGYNNNPFAESVTVTKADPSQSSTLSSSPSDSDPVASVPPPHPSNTISPQSPPIPPPDSTISPPTGSSDAGDAGPVFVEALYDHVADDDDELNFKVGDMVEVLEMEAGGWWKGRCHGQDGLFPVNYVQAPTGTPLGVLPP